LHVVTLTQRSNLPTGGASDSTDMDRETAEKVVNLAMQSSSPSITFEFQGGEPLLNIDVLRHFVDFAQTRNKRVEGKVLNFSLLTTLAGMTEEIAEWLIANEVLITTSLDGPAAIHDANRAWKGGSKHAEVLRWIEYFTRRYAELGLAPQQWHVSALLTTTRHTIGAWKEVVDEYVARGLRTIRLQPLPSVGLTPETWAKIGYRPDEYLAFYRKALDYVIDLNRRGIEIRERTASAIAHKILTAGEGGPVDLQSPCGEGTGQVVYHVDGRVFPSEDARLLDSMGDTIFDLGKVHDLSFSDLLRHPTVRAVAAASLLDVQPMCTDCWNKPYCGFSPVRTYISQSDLLGQRPRCFECKEHMAVSTQLFELLASTSDAKASEILQRWASEPHLANDGRVSNHAP